MSGIGNRMTLGHLFSHKESIYRPKKNKCSAHNIGDFLEKSSYRAFRKGAPPLGGGVNASRKSGRIGGGLTPLKTPHFSQIKAVINSNEKLIKYLLYITDKFVILYIGVSTSSISKCNTRGIY
jgi:hypothetical protein